MLFLLRIGISPLGLAAIRPALLPLPSRSWPIGATSAAKRKRAVNLSLNENLVAQAKTHTSNLSAIMETLLADFAATQQQARAARRGAAAG